MKNLGRYPDRDTSLAHNKLSQDRLAEVSMTEEQINSVVDSLTHNYIYPTQVDAEAQTKLDKTTLFLDGNLYVDNSQIGSSYASLSGGMVPNSQLPSHPSSHYLESSGLSYNSTRPSSVQAYGNSEASAGSVTISDPNYAWVPIIHGFAEIDTMGNAPAIIDVRDSSGRTVAGGISTMIGNYNVLNIVPENVPTAYLGNWTFTFYVKSLNGGSVRITSYQRGLHYFPAPWVRN